jgi:hypothetical protein
MVAVVLIVDVSTGATCWHSMRGWGLHAPYCSPVQQSPKRLLLRHRGNCLGVSTGGLALVADATMSRRPWQRSLAKRRAKNDAPQALSVSTAKSGTAKLRRCTTAARCSVSVVGKGRGAGRHSRNRYTTGDELACGKVDRRVKERYGENARGEQE